VSQDYDMILRRIVDPVDKWPKYDALLLKKLDAEWDLASFHPFSTKAMKAP